MNFSMLKKNILKKSLFFRTSPVAVNAINCSQIILTSDPSDTEDSSLLLHPDHHSGKWLILLSFTNLFKREKKKFQASIVTSPIRLRSRRVPVWIICLNCNFEKIIPVSFFKDVSVLTYFLFHITLFPPSPLLPSPFLAYLFPNLQ